MRVLLIDDEKPARDLVISYLSAQPSIELFEATNGFEGIKLINSGQYDVVLLDIQMPKINGFEMLELIENPPNIIFCTAYDEFAIKAFDQNAIDYLLKPFTKSRLLEALRKVNDNKAEKTIRPDALLTIKQPLERIVVKNAKSIDIIPVEEIRFLKSQDDYVEINTGTKKHLKQQRLKYYESALDTNIFVRVHRQFIVNIKYIARLDKFGKESYLAELKSGDSITISARGYSRLKEVLDM